MISTVSALFLIASLASLDGANAAGLFSSCSTSKDCSVANTACLPLAPACALAPSVQQICQCSPGFRSDGSKCLREARIDQVCDENTICTDESTSCSAGKCQCNSGYKRSPRDASRCISSLVTAAYGQACRDSVECEASQDCIEGKCSCLSGYFYSPANKTCVDVGLGDACQTDFDCINVYNAICSAEKPNVCVCEKDYSATQVTYSYGKIGRLCLPNPVSLGADGQPCSEDQSVFCQVGLSCRSCPQSSVRGYCAKPPVVPAYVPPPVTPAAPAAPTVSAAAAVTRTPATTPKQPTTPPTGTVKPSPMTTKKSVVRPGVGTPKTLAALGAGNAVDDPDDFIYDDDVFEETTPAVVGTKKVAPTTKKNGTPGTSKANQIVAMIGQPCAPPKTICGGFNAECIAGQCQCSDGFRQLGAGNICIELDAAIPIGQPCRGFDRCATAGASCVNNTCECQTGFKAGEKDDCIEKTRISRADQACNDHSQCYYGLRCTLYKCTCPYGMQQIGDYDCANRVLGNQCPSTFDRDCQFIQNGICKSGICTCQEGYVRKSPSECVEAVWQELGFVDDVNRQQPCVVDNDCYQTELAPRYSFCIDKVCQCNTNFMLNTRRNACEFTGVVTDEGSSCLSDGDCRRGDKLACIGQICSKARKLVASSADKMPTTPLTSLLLSVFIAASAAALTTN